MMLCEVAAYYKLQGKTLWDAMVELYEKYGYYKEELATVTLKGIDGSQKITAMMNAFRENPLKELGGFKVLACRDYKDFPHPMFFIMSWKTMHGAVFVLPELSQRSNTISV